MRFFILFFAFLILFPSSAPADWDPCYHLTWQSEIPSHVQESQNVQLQIVTHPHFEYECSINARFLLWRINEDENKIIFSDFDFTAGDYEGTNGCEGTGDDTDEIVDCEANPEDCHDCDGDGIPECPKYGCAEYHFNILDECVPPGPTSYHLSGLTDLIYGMDNQDGYLCIVEADMDVIDSGEECPPWEDHSTYSDPCIYPPPDHEPDDEDDDDLDDSGDDENGVADSDADDSSDEEGGLSLTAGDRDIGGGSSADSACGGCSTTGQDHAPPLASGMFVIGLAALIVASRKK